ncbi:TniQ family protein [Edaphobacter modestus]|uniref:TniQ protein n=1 Tax=Edaphobacter modestus TaxID=388466 RepID=A0A4Q7Y050_9BACT|nr:TniQ family protein [Edaphobacter modestus]RZU28909.1 TniQ protein [Edaphobacter modestus]
MSHLLPCHPHRLNIEILSTWMLRIASDNDVSVKRLCAWLGDDRFRALDSMAHYNPLINSIAEAVGVEKEIVIQSLPSGLYGLFGTSISPTGWPGTFPQQWRLLEGTPSRNLGNQYCPICLRKFGHYQLHGLSPSIVAAYSTSASFEIAVLIAERHFEVHPGFSTPALLIQKEIFNSAHIAADQS